MRDFKFVLTSLYRTKDVVGDEWRDCLRLLGCCATAVSFTLSRSLPRWDSHIQLYNRSKRDILQYGRLVLLSTRPQSESALPSLSSPRSVALARARECAGPTQSPSPSTSLRHLPSLLKGLRRFVTLPRPPSLHHTLSVHRTVSAQRDQHALGLGITYGAYRLP